MSQYHRPKGRVAFGIFAIILGTISLIGLPATSLYFGLGLFGAAYGAVMIALGLALIAKKETITE